MVEWLANLEIFAALMVLGTSLLLAGVTALSYLRLRNPRALLVGFGFLGFAAKGAFLTRLSWQTRGSEDWLLPVALLDLFVVMLFYLSMRKP